MRIHPRFIGRFLVVAALLWAFVILPAPGAQAAVSCTTYISTASYSASTHTITAKGAAYCTQYVYAQRIYVRIYRTDVSPAQSLAGNGLVCYSSMVCPNNSRDLVVTKATIGFGCHPYEARSGGWYTPYGEPPAIQFDSYRDTWGMGTICR